MKTQKKPNNKLNSPKKIHERFFITPGMMHREIRRSMSDSVHDETFVVPWQIDNEKQAPRSKEANSEDGSHLWNSF